MQSTIIHCLTALAGAMLISGCTDTVYREVPTPVYAVGADVGTAMSDNATPMQSIQATSALPVGNMAGSTASIVAGTSTTASATSNMSNSASNSATTDSTSMPLESPAAVTAATGTPLTSALFADAAGSQTAGTLAPASADTVVGIAGQSVDCKAQVPCLWTSADAQLALTVTNADNIASRDRLSINFSVSTAHDTTLLIGSVDDTIDSAFVRNKPADLQFDSGNGSTPVTVVAGTTVTGTVNFSNAATTSLLSTVTITVLDGGLIRTASLLNVPVGPVTTDYAQCNNTMPCVWVSPAGDVAISLLSVGGYAGNGRLTANFHINGTRDMQVAVDAGADAIGDDGTRFSGRTHSLGTVNGFDKLTAESLADIGISGTVDFFRTSTIPNSLLSLSLIVFEDAPSPRWNPRFVDVPIQ